MLFTSYDFILLFLPIAVAGYWLVARTNRAKHIWLLIASSLFYLYNDFGQFILLIVLISVTYLSARYLLASDSAGKRRGGLALTLGNIIILASFKYLRFFALSATAVGLALPIQQLALPLGLSFYTFNLVAYSIDVYRGRLPPEPSYIRFAAYVTFFPAIFSGPLIRYGPFAKQLDTVRKLDRSQIELGMFSFTVGLAKKLIIADYLATIADPLFAHAEDLHFIGAWVAALAYTYQLYFDFSGYSDMAIGIGYFLGLVLPQNFDAPYSSRTIA